MSSDKFSFSELNRKVRRGRRGKGRLRLSQVFHVVFQAIYWLLLIFIGVGFGLMFVLSQDLPDVKTLEDYEPSLPTQVFDRNGELITQFRVERRTLRPMSAMPQHLLDATISIEDERFYKHNGIDLEAIGRAAWRNLKAWALVEGGSTLTQQLTREMFLTKERTIIRKLKEQLLALEVEKSYTKEEILYFYLNQVYYGHNAYGAEAAAKVYFDKHVEELTIGEAAMIAGMVKNPAGYSPFVHPEAAKHRRNTVLYKMNELGYISDEEYETTRNTPIKTADMEKEPDEAPYFSEYIRRILVKRYGSERIF
ncbi:MAG: penicillin-binding protein, partial [bacterium]|nr:penicillin-binding protein [bacterium]